VCATHVLPMRVAPFAFRYQGNGATRCQYIYRGGIEPWWMARWKARDEFLLSIIELLISLTVEALQGKRCQNSLPSGVGRSLGAKISGARGYPWGIFFGFYETRDILRSDSAKLHRAMCRRFDTIPACDRWTDRQTELP